MVQTTGDLLTDRIVDDLLERGVWMISVASVDDFHVGLEGPEKQKRFVDKLTGLFERHGMHASGLAATTRNWHEETGPLYSFFGATPDSWIGKLWPRGRAWENSLSKATLADNFCNRWSGGLNFLRHQFNGSEVSVEPDGAVYPCCVKTKLPIGSLLEDNLIDILESLVGVPAFEAISMGHPERMGIAHDWSEEEFEYCVERASKGQKIEQVDWSSGTSLKPQKGDRAFFTKTVDFSPRSTMHATLPKGRAMH